MCLKAFATFPRRVCDSLIADCASIAFNKSLTFYKILDLLYAEMTKMCVINNGKDPVRLIIPQ